ncbi:MAG: SIS domain-containing protein [Pseudomonadota bacterium]
MTRADQILDELRPGLSPDVLGQLPAVVSRIAGARRIVCHGVGREGLMMKALAMRLFHLGLDAHVLGDMTTPPVGDGDLLFVSAGPGDFATISALGDVAHRAGAAVMCVTAEPDGPVPAAADLVLHIPAQTMASDAASTSILPMGSLFEALVFLVFEILVLDLRAHLGLSPDAMRANHTNLE